MNEHNELVAYLETFTPAEILDAMILIAKRGLLVTGEDSEYWGLLVTKFETLQHFITTGYDEEKKRLATESLPDDAHIDYNKGNSSR